MRAPGYLPAMLLLHAVILIIIGLSFLGLVVNLAALRTLEAVPEVKSAGKVSILIPARNEERSIGECMGSLLAQDYPDFEVIVLDDCSTDRTGEIVRELCARNLRGRLIAGAPLPAGWCGKNWACHQLAEAATGEWLVFTDADTWHEPGMVSSAVEMAVRERIDLLSAWPRLVTVTLGEKLVIPVLHVVALSWFPLAFLQWVQDRPEIARRIPRRWLRACAGANGQFVLFRREAYQRIGGHARVRDHIVEDMALGREIGLRMADGMRLLNVDGRRLAACRMYRSFSEVCDGFTKNARAAFEDSLASWVFVGGGQFLGFFLPFVLLLVPGHRALAMAEVGLLYAMRLVLVLRMGTSWTGAALHPVGQFLAMAIGIRSWIKTLGPGVEWKGRTYTTVYTAQGGHEEVTEGR